MAQIDNLNSRLDITKITESCFILQDVYGSEDAIMALIERRTIQ
ncbi:MAG: hypothetical protein AB4426_20775 [Xenococcaceae cyanobacterium]